MKKGYIKFWLAAGILSLSMLAGCGVKDKKVVVDIQLEDRENKEENSELEINENDSDNVEIDINDEEIKDQDNIQSDKEDIETSDEDDVDKDNTDKENKESTNKESTNKENADKEDSEKKETGVTGNPVSIHGKLSVDGTKIVDKNGKPFQIQGVSTHGLGWFPAYVNKAGFQTMRDEWGINCVRLAMYTAEYNGYCSGGNKTDLKNLVNNGVSYASELGLYVIIDWHILSDNDPNINKSEAIAFFKEMSGKYKNFDNVIYEICNEPNGGTSWSDIKSYAEQVIPVIKANDPDAIIIVGTPTWSQEVDKAAADPITGYNNIMYTIHFYADTHKDDLRNKMQSAIDKGLPIFCTEFGITDASGNGSVNTSEGDKWIAALQKNNVGYCIWNLSNKDESSALLVSSCNKTSGWSESDLSAEGKWYLGVLGGKAVGRINDTSEDSDNTGSDNQPANGKHPANDDIDVSSETSGNISVSMKQTGNWNDGKDDFYQYTITVKSVADPINGGWKVMLDFGTDVTIDQSWSANFKDMGNGSFVATPVDYNKEIEAGKSIEFGIIIKGSSVNPSVKVI